MFDKDLASALLASQVDADLLLISTAVEQVARARELGTSARMQSAGRRIEQNQMGQAIGLQGEIQEGLEEDGIVKIGQWGTYTVDDIQ